MALVNVFESRRALRRSIIFQLRGSYREGDFRKGLVIINADEIDEKIKLEMPLKVAKEKGCPVIFYSEHPETLLRNTNPIVASLLSKQNVSFIQAPFSADDIKKLYNTLIVS